MSEISSLIKPKGYKASVIMKYIENPLIIWKRKVHLPQNSLYLFLVQFDIRQWVLVTSWNPLTVWFYEECYIRFAAEDYKMSNIKHKFGHLTNNSIAKHSKKKNDKIKGNMWDVVQFNDYLKVLMYEI